MEMECVIYTAPGNFFSAANYLNENDLAQWLIQMEHTGNYTQCVFLMPRHKKEELQAAKIIR